MIQNCPIPLPEGGTVQGIDNPGVMFILEIADGKSMILSYETCIVYA